MKSSQVSSIWEDNEGGLASRTFAGGKWILRLKLSYSTSPDDSITPVIFISVHNIMLMLLLILSNGESERFMIKVSAERSEYLARLAGWLAVECRW